MKHIRHVFSDTDNELVHWKNLLGGDLQDNSLLLSEGVIKEYRFGTHNLLVMRFNLKEDVITNRIMKKPTAYCPIVLSDNLTFEPEADGTTVVLPSKSSTTGIYFSNEDTLFHSPSGTDCNIILLRVPYETFSKLLPSGHLFLKTLRENTGYHFYESIGLEMKMCMRQMVKPAHIPALENEFIRAWSWELFLLFVEKFFYQRINRYTEIDNDTLRKLRDVKDFMLSDLSAPKRIEELVRYTGLSATRLRSSFKEVYGMSMYSMFLEHRMEKACQMLLKDGQSVSEVAYAMGYTNLSHFTEAFKKKFHCLPKEIRLSGKIY